MEKLEPLLLSINDTAVVLGKGRKKGGGRSKIYELIADGKLHAVKDGVNTKVTVASIKSYLESLPKFQSAAGKGVRARPPHNKCGTAA
jgi:hypothetical protein